jgi:hypothetical protein
MTKPVALLLGVHAHQPVGNFPEVLDEAHERCYRPFLQMMHRYPDFRFSIHISGWLLDYLHQRYPEDVALLAELVQRGQAELFGAGYTEPVLASIPEQDRIGQIERMSGRLQDLLGQRPRGSWLTERVWDSTVVTALAGCGIRYVTVDDYHFLCTGKHNDELAGYFSTEENGQRLDIFPISEALRYRLPFSPAHEAVDYLENLHSEGGRSAAIYFDDIEKFGIWPQTYEWVYEKGWLEEFIQRVLRSDRIIPMRYGDFHALTRTRGVVYLPTTSYVEMNEWTLPADAARRYAQLIQGIRNEGHYDWAKPFLRGGIWKNFFSRYPESNWMHKRMLHLSARFHALAPSERTPAMAQALYEGQANDAYWHGLFGGLYLPHLRRAIYRSLVRLEGLLDDVSPRPPHAWNDLDFDGHEELFLQNGILQAVIRDDGNADVNELDAYRLQHNFGDTLSRQSEHYHAKLSEQPAHDSQHEEGIANPHETTVFKHDIQAEDLVIDSLRRSLFIDRWQDENGCHVLEYQRREGSGAGDSAHFQRASGNATTGKHYRLSQNVLEVAYDLAPGCRGEFSVELNLAMPSCDGPAGSFRRGGEVLGGFGQPLAMESMAGLTLHDEVLGGALQLSASPPCRLKSEPCFSISQSEAGFEKIMQAVTITLFWDAGNLRTPIYISLAVAP